MIKDYVLIPFDKFNPHKLSQTTIKGKKPQFVCEGYGSLDTETSKEEMRPEEFEAWLYQWSFSYPAQPPMMKRQMVYGRKPSELAKALKKIVEVNGLDSTHKFNFFIHNASFDYHYIKDFLEREFGHKGQLLAIGTHRIITYTIEGLCFRCSYRLSQKSLDRWGRELGIRHRKLKGTIDYNVVRYQDSKLTKKDWKYMFYDVVVLDECVEKQFSKWNDNETTVPLTMTGYVRRECFKYFKSEKYYRNEFKNNALNATTYGLCRKEFSGGITHGNRFHMEETIRVKDIMKQRGGVWYIKHRDFASHYPSQQITGFAPASKFSLYYDNTKHDKPEEKKMKWNKLAKLAKENCVLVAIVISDLKLKNLGTENSITLPYAQVSKFREGEIHQPGVEKLTFVEDNGRIIKMKSGMSLVVLNEYDLKWLKRQYDFSYEIETVYTARRGRFPKWLTDTVNEFFYKKSYYKKIEKQLEENNVSKESPEYIENHLNLMIAKGMLNAIYGCTASRPIRDLFYERKDGFWGCKKPNKDEIEEQLQKYYDNEKNFMPYQLGCWTTAQARNELMEFVELIGYENFLYADTDSIFYISNDEIEARIENVNAKFREENDKNGWFIEVDGEKTYYNQFELEKEKILEFRFVHAKCYAYVVEKTDKKTGKTWTELEATIAGVQKIGRNGVSRTKELGSIENLFGVDSDDEEKKTVFTSCGGTEVEYINRPCQYIVIDEHVLEVASAAIIKETTKTLHSAKYYAENLISWEIGELE